MNKNNLCIKIFNPQTGNSLVIEEFSVWAIVRNSYSNACREESFWHDGDAAVGDISQIYQVVCVRCKSVILETAKALHPFYVVHWQRVFMRCH
jgi:hypothetical protein